MYFYLLKRKQPEHFIHLRATSTSNATNNQSTSNGTDTDMGKPGNNDILNEDWFTSNVRSLDSIYIYVCVHGYFVSIILMK